MNDIVKAIIRYFRTTGNSVTIDELGDLDCIPMCELEDFENAVKSLFDAGLIEYTVIDGVEYIGPSYEMYRTEAQRNFSKDVETVSDTSTLKQFIVSNDLDTESYFTNDDYWEIVGGIYFRSDDGNFFITYKRDDEGYKTHEVGYVRDDGKPLTESKYIPELERMVALLNESLERNGPHIRDEF